MSSNRSSGPRIIGILVLALLVLYQDNWFWTDDRLVWGFMPIGMFWHACLSLAAAGTWFLATKIAWPIDTTPACEIAPAGANQLTGDTAAADTAAADTDAADTDAADREDDPR